MTVSKIQPQLLSDLVSVETLRMGVPPWRSRLIARIFAAKLDRAVDRCDPVPAGSALAAHVERLSSRTQRALLADGLRSVVRLAGDLPAGLSMTVPVHRGRVNAAADLIDEITMLLDAPVRARGVARLRLLLSNGAGPLYSVGRGSLNAELRGVLAAL